MTTGATLTDYTHTGADTIPDVRSPFMVDTLADIIDAPNFIPCGYHFAAAIFGGGPAAAHTIRPGAFR